jgi:hypothetical protein
MALLLLPEPGPGPEQPDAHRARRHVQDGSGLLGGEPRDIHELDHGPVELGQLRATLDQLAAGALVINPGGQLLDLVVIECELRRQTAG